MSTVKTGNRWRERGNYIALNEKEKTERYRYAFILCIQSVLFSACIVIMFGNLKEICNMLF